MCPKNRRMGKRVLTNHLALCLLMLIKYIGMGHCYMLHLISINWGFQLASYDSGIWMGPQSEI